MINRRKFIKQLSLTGGGIILSPLFSSRLLSKPMIQYFAIHEFIENNPDAVFIMRTDVGEKTDAAAIKQVGLDFGGSVFINTEDETKGVPLDHAFAIKPNLTSWRWDAGDSPFVENMGIITDVNFVEGVIESMKSRSISADDIYIREVNGSENMDEGGYSAMAARTGADVQVIGESIKTISDDKVQWIDIPEGIFFTKLPYLKPINIPDSWLLNISKFKAHSMGLTLCAKNLQGSIVNNYQRHCDSYNVIKSEIDPNHVRENTFDLIKSNYDRHLADGVPRWDISGWDFTSGLGMETWASRCTDNNSALQAGLHIIEGVYGRDGNGFHRGPNDGKAWDYMSNIIVFGKNAFHVDIIGHWLGSHEPGNFGLFHIAKEHGLSTYLNPMDIPVYEWKPDATATLAQLTDFDEAQVKEILGIPPRIRVVELLPIGYPLDASPVNKNRLPLKKIVKYERWQ